MVVPGMYLSARANKHKTHIRDKCTQNARNREAYLFGVGEVLKEGILAPDNSLLLVSLGVLEACSLTRMPAEQTVATS